MSLLLEADREKARAIVEDAPLANSATAWTLTHDDKWLVRAIASALAEERERTWSRAIEIASTTWATTTMGRGRVKIENQAEYERARIVEALIAEREKQ